AKQQKRQRHGHQLQIPKNRDSSLPYGQNPCGCQYNARTRDGTTHHTQKQCDHREGEFFTGVYMAESGLITELVNDYHTRLLSGYSPFPSFFRSTRRPMQKAMMPTPIPVCTQNSMLSTSPGSSPPRIVSIRGAAMGSKEESTSSTTWLPASSEPPNSASFRANRGMKAIRSIAKIGRAACRGRG